MHERAATTRQDQEPPACRLTDTSGLVLCWYYGRQQARPKLAVGSPGVGSLAQPQTLGQRASLCYAWDAYYRYNRAGVQVGIREINVCSRMWFLDWSFRQIQLISF